jgi:hypothetical protein
MLRQKALRLFRSNIKDAAPNYLHGKSYNEPAIGEQTGLVTPKRQVVSPRVPTSGIHWSGTTRCDLHVGSTDREGVLEDKWSSDMSQDLVVVGDVSDKRRGHVYLPRGR